MLDQFTAIDGKTYGIEKKLDAKRQGHVFQSLLPVIKPALFMTGNKKLRELVLAMRDSADGGPSKVSWDDVLNMMPDLDEASSPVVEAFSRLPFQTVDAVTDICLSTVVVQQAGATGWSRLMTPSGQLMYEEMDFDVMMQLVWRVLVINLRNFSLFRRLQSAAAVLK